MASPVPPELNRGVIVTAVRGSNRLAVTGFVRLAVTSFVLSLVPLVVLAIAVVFTVMPFSANLASWLRWALLIGGFVVIIGAVVSAIFTGVLALRQAMWYPPQHAMRGFAATGQMIRIVGTVFFLLLFAFVSLLYLLGLRHGFP